MTKNIKDTSAKGEFERRFTQVAQEVLFGRQTIKQMAAQFQISGQTMSLRLFRVGILSKPPTDAAIIKLMSEKNINIEEIVKSLKKFEPVKLPLHDAQFVKFHVHMAINHRELRRSLLWGRMAASRFKPTHRFLKNVAMLARLKQEDEKKLSL